MDCGGSCNPCENEKTCSKNSDCKSKSCMSGRCKKTSCADGLKDGDETGIDCGGSCSACQPGERCLKDSDCLSEYCRENKCRNEASEASAYNGPDCSNGVRDTKETDVDCGGECQKCADEKKCAKDADCLSEYCAQGACKAQSCTDGIKNQNETGTDCGGPCKACQNQTASNQPIKEVTSQINNAMLIAISILAVLLVVILNRGGKEDKKEANVEEGPKEDLTTLDTIDAELEALFRKNKNKKE